MKRIQILDYARFAAAFAVLLFHYTYGGIRNGKIDSITHVDSIIQFTKHGHLGVEFFFMISGYVIFFSARYREAPAFAASRAKRLFPAYWVAIIFTSAFAIFLGGELMAVTPKMIIANFSMLQNYIGIENVDGVYWTLLYELRFYAAVFVILCLGLRRYLAGIFLAWPLMIIGFLLFDIQSSHLLIHYRYLYFAAGGLFALITEKSTVPRIASLLVTMFSCTYIGSSALSSIPKAVIILSFFAFFGACLISKIRDLQLPMSRHCGAITYPLYLIHAHFGYMMLSVFASDANKVIVYPIVIASVLILSWGLHQLIEVRLSSFWSRFFSNALESPISNCEQFLFSRVKHNKVVRSNKLTRRE
ncbi:MAG: acyltransferase [Verrucomicrobiota bacterium]